jgi:nitric oxide reductase NorQ protein
MKKPDYIVRIEKQGNTYRAFDISSSSHEYTDQIKRGALVKAYKMNYKLGRFKRPNPISTLETHMWRKLDIPNIEDTPKVEIKSAKLPEEQLETMQFIHSSYELKPDSLTISELKWKYLIRSAVRGKNIMMTGPAGCGKTMSAKALVNALDRPDFYFNLGATQDPRATLIGNTHFNSDEGTYFAESLFVQAIRTPNAVILLDELTRAHPDAWNILMTVLDQNQRYLRLDEKSDSETVRVAEGVTFIATANIGNEYTATRVLDKALMDRFTIIEMDVLTEDKEYDLLQYMFPNVDKEKLSNVAKIANLTRIEANNENPRISSGISTRTSIEIAGLMYDGFELQDAADITIYPQYDATGGVDSERTFVKQVVQKFINDGTEEELFNSDEQEAIVS